MGTDFSFADIDRRDLRDGRSRIEREEKIAKRFDCWVLETTPQRTDSEYARILTWVRKDNFVPLKMEMFDKAQVLLKTFQALEVKRVTGRWFITKSKMVNHREQHETELTLTHVVPKDDIADDQFNVRNLEKN
jgi:outer membrane lipoprotein-sorting protein